MFKTSDAEATDFPIASASRVFFKNLRFLPYILICMSVKLNYQLLRLNNQNAHELP